jgi:hypothetical protein
MRSRLPGLISVSAALASAVAGPPAARQTAGCVDLVAETVPVVGRVCVTEAADSVFVRFVLDGGWRLAETHVAVAPSLDSLPKGGGGHPILGRFPHKATHGRDLSEFVYAIASAGLTRGPDGSLVVAAHAEILRGDQNEGAWAKGQAFTDGGGPATYFIYRRPGTTAMPAVDAIQRRQLPPLGCQYIASFVIRSIRSVTERSPIWTSS